MAGRCVLYDEIGANAKSVLNKDFVNKTSFTGVVHPLACALAGSALAADVNASMSTATTFNRDGSVNVVVCPTATWRGTRASVEVTNAKARKIKATLVQEGLLPGLRVGAEWAVREWARVSTAYKHAHFSVRGEVSAEATPTGTTAVAVQCKRTGVVAGGLVTYATRPAEPTVYGSIRAGSATRAEGCIGYVSPAMEITAYTNSLGHVLGCSVFRKLNPRTTVALDTHFDVTKTGADRGMPSVEAGVMFQIDSAASVKAKVNTECVVSFSYVHQLSKYARAVLSGAVSATNLSAAGTHTFGFSLVLSD